MPRGRKSIWAGVKSRGLCRRCYSCANWLVRWGLTTWEELERNGKLTAARFRSGTGNRPKTRVGRNAHIKAWLLDQEEGTSA